MHACCRSQHVALICCMQVQAYMARQQAIITGEIEASRPQQLFAEAELRRLGAELEELTQRQRGNKKTVEFM